MLKQRVQQHIRFAKIEKPHAWLIVAVLLETRDGETIAISEPKVVRIISKHSTPTLSGSVSSSLALLPAYEGLTKKVFIASPYFSTIFGFSTTHNLTGLAPQPPTIS